MPECPTQHLFGDYEIWEHCDGGREKTNENLPEKTNVIRPTRTLGNWNEDPQVVVLSSVNVDDLFDKMSE